MTDVDPAALLDAPAVPDAGDVAEGPWFGAVAASLADVDPWLTLVDTPGALTTDRAWRLLNWPEEAATQVVRRPRAGLVETAAVALALLEGGPLDRREARVVGSLVRHACGRAGIDFAAAVRVGCGRVGARGEACLDWLWRTPADLPGTHGTHGAGPGFRYDRRPAPAIDVDALARWVRGET